jgi:hypothetical protein
MHAFCWRIFPYQEFFTYNFFLVQYILFLLLRDNLNNFYNEVLFFIWFFKFKGLDEDELEKNTIYKQKNELEKIMY